MKLQRPLRNLHCIDVKIINKQGDELDKLNNHSTGGKQMRIKDIVKATNQLLKIPEQDQRLLTRCACLIVKEIAIDYCPIIYEQTIIAKDNKVKHCQLDKILLEVKSIKDKSNNEVAFIALSDHIFVKDGEYTISYSYIPKCNELSDEVPLDTEITSKIISYGTASEYCIFCGRYEEALIYEEKYKEALIRAIKEVKL